MVVPAHGEATCDSVRQSALDAASGTSSEQRLERLLNGVSDPALASVVARWKSLPEHVRQAIVTLVNVAGSVE